MNYTFTTSDDFNVLTTRAGDKIFMANAIECDRVYTSGGAVHVGARANKWLADHPEARADVINWQVERDRALATWKHGTPHARYNCDCGCLSVTVNGARVLVSNRHGDGNFPVYIVNDGDFVPPTFVPAGVSVSACDLEILDYDCDGANVIASRAVNSATFLVDGEGAVVVRVVPAGK